MEFMSRSNFKCLYKYDIMATQGLISSIFFNNFGQFYYIKKHDGSALFLKKYSSMEQEWIKQKLDSQTWAKQDDQNAEGHKDWKNGLLYE